MAPYHDSFVPPIGMGFGQMRGSLYGPGQSDSAGPGYPGEFRAQMDFVASLDDRFLLMAGNAVYATLKQEVAQLRLEKDLFAREMSLKEAHVQQLKDQIDHLRSSPLQSAPVIIAPGPTSSTAPHIHTICPPLAIPVERSKDYPLVKTWDSSSGVDHAEENKQRRAENKKPLAHTAFDRIVGVDGLKIASGRIKEVFHALKALWTKLLSFEEYRVDRWSAMPDSAKEATYNFMQANYIEFRLCNPGDNSKASAFVSRKFPDFYKSKKRSRALAALGGSAKGPKGLVINVDSDEDDEEDLEDRRSPPVNLGSSGNPALKNKRDHNDDHRPHKKAKTQHKAPAATEELHTAIPSNTVRPPLRPIPQINPADYVVPVPPAVPKPRPTPRPVQPATSVKDREQDLEGRQDQLGVRPTAPPAPPVAPSIADPPPQEALTPPAELEPLEDTFEDLSFPPLDSPAAPTGPSSTTEGSTDPIPSPTPTPANEVPVVADATTTEPVQPAATRPRQMVIKIPKRTPKGNPLDNLEIPQTAIENEPIPPPKASTNTADVSEDTAPVDPPPDVAEGGGAPLAERAEDAPPPDPLDKSGPMKLTPGNGAKGFFSRAFKEKNPSATQKQFNAAWAAPEYQKERDDAKEKAASASKTRSKAAKGASSG